MPLRRVAFPLRAIVIYGFGWVDGRRRGVLPCGKAALPLGAVAGDVGHDAVERARDAVEGHGGDGADDVDRAGGA